MATAPVAAPASGFVPRGANGSPDYASAGQTTQAYQNTGANDAGYTTTANPNGGTQVKSVGGGNYISYPATGTMNAQITSPDSTVKTPAPAVITSNAAQTDLANKQSQVNQLNADVANHAAVVNSSLPQAPSGTDVSNTTSNSSASNTPSNTTPSSLDDQINDILSGFSSNASGIEDAATKESDTLGNEAAEAQADLDSAAATSLTQLKQIASGVYPLSPAEQSLLTSTTQGFQQAIQYQTQANASYTGQMTEAMASLGISTSAPTEAIGLIHAAISSGSSKITDLNSQMATSLANIELGFQKQDFDMVQQSWDETSTYMENRISTLTSMQKNINDLAHQQVQDLQSATQMNLTSIINADTLDEKTKQDSIQNAFQQQQITETQRHDLQTELTDRMSAGKGMYQYNPDTGTVFNTATGQMAGQGSGAILNGTVQPGHSGVPIVDNNTKTTSSGIPYVDGTTLTGDQSSEAQLEAAKLGIPYLGSASASALNSIEAARTNLQNIATTISDAGTTPGNIIEKAGDLILYPVEGATQSGDYGPTVAAYNTYRSAAIKALQAVAGGTGSGLRINQAEIQMSIQNDIPQLTDTAETANKKMAIMDSLLDSNESQLVGGSAYQKFSSGSQTNPLALPATTNVPTPSSNNQLGI